MKKLLLLIAALVPAAVFAQQVKDPALVEEFRENPYRVCVNMYPYEYSPGPQTPAPKGFKPFYISHYGRHGARTNWGGDYQAILDRYAAARQAGLLTEDGEKAYEIIAELIRLHDGMDGRLTPLGQREHAQIAERMYRNYPEVFKKGSKKIFAVSSVVPRCIISMNASTGKLLSLQGDLDILWDTGATFQKYVSSEHTRFMRDSMRVITRDYRSRHIPDTAAFLKRIFTDPERGRLLTGSALSLERETFNMACGCPALELGDHLFTLFTEDDLYWYGQEIGVKFYLGQCNSVEFGDIRMPLAMPLAQDIIQKADNAIATGEYCADLRYGHDYQLLAISSIFHLEGVDQRWTAREAEAWHGWKYTPFCANFQLIFYRNKKGDVLVKPLLNERETPIVGLEGGPYYKWEDIKDFISHLSINSLM